MDELSAHRALRTRGPAVALLDEPAPAALRPPADPVGHLRRPRLLRMLDRGLRGHVTVVSAPAGYGKSTLLAAWAARRRERGPVAWVSLDPGAGDPVRFWTAVSDALRAGGAVRGCPATAAGVAEALERARAPVVLVLDDLHELEGAPAAAGLARLVRHPPAALRLVAGVRGRAPLSLERLRVAGLSHGGAIAPPLRRAIRAGTPHRALVGELLAAVESRREERPGPKLVADALSERELMVLRYLPTVLTNSEIAAELFVSVNTVKTHVKSIYRKLDVSERRSAVRRARALRLLAP